MAIVVVSGAGRGAGKTALVCGVISALRDMQWVAVKISPHTHNVEGPLREEIVPGEETDTERYLTAGASKSFLITASNGKEMQAALNRLWEKTGRDANFIFESNRVLQLMKPDVCLVVGRGSEAEEKETDKLIAEHADAIVLHTGDMDPGEPPGEVENRLSVFQLDRFENLSPRMVGWISGRLSRS
jgi:hypothetical protein